MAATTELVRQAQDRIRRWRADPVAFVVENFGIQPDAWQIDALNAIGGECCQRRRVAMKACTGPGKSAVLSWAGWHRLSCFASKSEHPKGAAVSITGDNLKDNLWPELSKWQGRSAFLTEAFEFTKEKIYARDHPATWFLSARSFAKDANEEAIGRTLSGLHSQFPFVLLDETGDMPRALGRAAQQIFTGNPTDALIMQAGNPTDTTGLLYESCTDRAWTVITITADPDDPKRTPRVSVEHAREMIDKHGRDNPWVMATILGLFPPGGFNKLLSVDDVEAAMNRHLRSDQYDYAAKVMGVDVARAGLASSVICRRQGFWIPPLEQRRGLGAAQGSDWVGRAWDDWQADGVFIDATGGYGAYWVEALELVGRRPVGVTFSAQASDPRQFYNKRAEIGYRFADWVKKGGALPRDPEFAAELTEPTYSHRATKHGNLLLIEPKELVAERLGRSPDKADAAWLTMSEDVTPGLYRVNTGRSMVDRSTSRSQYDPFANV